MLEENNEGSLKEDPMKGGEIGRELDKQKLKKKEKVWVNKSVNITLIQALNKHMREQK